MPFEFNHTMQSDIFFEGLKTSLYEKIAEASEKSSWMRASGPLVAIASAALTLSMRVAEVVESIIKGLANIFGSPFSEKCSALKGLKQIFISLPSNVFSLAIAPFEIGIGGIVTTFGMAINPRGYPIFRKNEHAKWLMQMSEGAAEDFNPVTVEEMVLQFIYA